MNEKNERTQKYLKNRKWELESKIQFAKSQIIRIREEFLVYSEEIEALQIKLKDRKDQRSWVDAPGLGKDESVGYKFKKNKNLQEAKKDQKAAEWLDKRIQELQKALDDLSSFDEHAAREAKRDEALEFWNDRITEYQNELKKVNLKLQNLNTRLRKLTIKQKLFKSLRSGTEDPTKSSNISPDKHEGRKPKFAIKDILTGVVIVALILISGEFFASSIFLHKVLEVQVLSALLLATSALLGIVSFLAWSKRGQNGPSLDSGLGNSLKKLFYLEMVVGFFLSTAIMVSGLGFMALAATQGYTLGIGLGGSVLFSGVAALLISTIFWGKLSQDLGEERANQLTRYLAKAVGFTGLALVGLGYWVLAAGVTASGGGTPMLAILSGSISVVVGCVSAAAGVFFLIDAIYTADKRHMLARSSEPSPFLLINRPSFVGKTPQKDNLLSIKQIDDNQNYSSEQDIVKQEEKIEESYSC